MKKPASLILCVSLALSAAAAAQQATGVQTNASGETRTNVSADRSRASASGSAAGSATATTDQGSASLAHGSEMNATLSKSVDARKAKPGDEVTAVVNEDIKSDGQVVIRKGSKLVGHVTAARPLGKTNGSAEGAADSQLGIVFDRAVVKGGREVPLHATVQALAAAESSASMGMNSASTGMGAAGGAAGSARSTGGGLVGGVAGSATGAVGGVAGSAGGIANTTVGASAGVLSRSSGAVGGLNAAGRLTSGSKGVFGMKDVELSSVTSGSAQDSVLSSSTRNVRLDRGTHMLLVHGSGSGNAAIDTSKAASSASGSAVGSAGVTRSGNGTVINAAGDATGAADVSGGKSQNAARPETPPASAQRQ